MASAVLDASAVLALFKGERGAGIVKDHVPGAAISAVNLAEVVTKLAEAGLDRDMIDSALATLGADIVDCNEARAIEIGMLRAETKAAGLSLGDRACLALARETGLSAITADTAWRDLGLGIDVELIREGQRR